jgi:hypothetical protein
VLRRLTITPEGGPVTLSYDSDLTYDVDDYSYLGGHDRATALVTLAGISFAGVADDEGREWIVTNLEGWDSPDVRAAVTNRPQADGAWVGDFWHAARMLEVTGFVDCPTVEAAWRTKDELARAMNLLRSSAELVVVEDAARQVSVRRNGRLLLKQTGGLLEFSIPLIAPDPHKYAVIESTAVGQVGESLVATNAGSVATPASATITGPVSEPILRNVTTGEEIAVDADLDDGETMEVDFDLHTVTIDGVSQRHAVLSGYRWWRLEPGDNGVRLDGSGYTAVSNVELRWRSAWI